MTSTQSVTDLLLVDGKQPGVSSSQPQAAPFSNPLGEAPAEVSPSTGRVSPTASQAIFGGARANVGGCHVTPVETAHTCVENHTGIVSLAARESEKSLHSFSNPSHVLLPSETDILAGADTSVADPRPAFYSP